jgi:hypothetical protein
MIEVSLESLDPNVLTLSDFCPKQSYFFGNILTESFPMTPQSLKSAASSHNRNISQ